MRARDENRTRVKDVLNSQLAQFIGVALIVAVIVLGINGIVASCSRQEAACVQSGGNWDGDSGDCTHSHK